MIDIAPAPAELQMMMIIRGAQVPADVTAGAGLPGRLPDADPLQGAGRAAGHR
jgi:hypothetical protein